MLSKHIVRSLILSAILCSCISLSARAQPPDFTICDGLRGQAGGLCRAGVAVGCDIDDTHPGCSQIEELFRNVTGTSPPWSACPCDYFSEVPINTTNWDVAYDVELGGSCTTTHRGFRLRLRSIGSPKFTQLTADLARDGASGQCTWVSEDPPGGSGNIFHLR